MAALGAGGGQPQVGVRQVVGDIGRQIGGRVVNSALGIVVLVLLARLLGEEDYGRWTTILAIIALVSPLAELGLSQVAVQRAAADPAQEGSWIGALMTTRTVLGLGATAGCVAAVAALADDRTMLVAGAVVSATTLLAPASALSAFFQLRVRNHLAIVVMTVNSVLWTAAIVVLAASGGGLIAVGVAFAGAATLSSAVQVVLAMRCGRPSFDGPAAARERARPRRPCR